jgi:hypothetical protein
MIMITSLMQSVHEQTVGQGCCKVQYVSFMLPILNLYAAHENQNLYASQSMLYYYVRFGVFTFFNAVY